MKLSSRTLLPLSMALLAAGSARTQTLSSSKLSAHLINSYTSGGASIIAGHPRTLKVLGLDSGFPSGMAQAMRDYKAQTPGGKVVVRIYSPRMWSLADDATASASDFWTNVLQKGVNYLSPSDRALIDYLEGPNEGQTPTLGYPNSTPDQALQASAWFNQFWTNLTPKIVAAGYKPCIGSIAVGNPGGDMNAHLTAFTPALRQAQAASGAWSYHAYTINYTTDVGVEIWYSLRYRQFYSYFASAAPDLTGIPLILTEGGVDQNGTPATSGWQSRGSAADYERWLNWFDQQMQQDPYILGCTLFEIGNPEPWGWPSFDLEPIASWMNNYLTQPAAAPSAPTGVTATPGNGTVTLSWTSPPLNPTTWSVKRGTNNGGPYFTVATGVNTGVTATTWTDTPVDDFTTYYYVITAVNGAGESHNSAPVTVTPTAPVPTAINCGGGAVGAFLPDMYFGAGQGSSYSVGNSISTNGVSNPAPEAVYQSQHYGDVDYTLPWLAPNTSYKVRLHFAEIYWSAVGQRVFNVFLNGVQVLANYDIVQAAVGSFKADVREFNAISDSAGTIRISLVTVVDNASINGIEVIPAPGSSVPAAPTGLTAAVSAGLVTLAWSVPAGTTGLIVRRSTTSGGPYSIIASNLTQAIYRDPSFTPNTTYYYVISASNGFGESSFSAETSARPATGLPDLVVTSVNWSPTVLFNGSHTVFTATVLNQGSAALTTSSLLGVGFNLDGAATVSWYSGNISLAPGASIVLTANGGPAGVNYWTATGGRHTIIATVDDVNRIAESIEDNNAKTVPFPVSVPGYAINCGGPAAGSFAADSNFAGSANTFSVASPINTSGVANAAPEAVYQSERWGEMAYVLGNLVPGSNYTLRLHFAEISPSVTSPGDRRFNVSLNGVQALTDYDILAATGTKFRALTREIRKQADASGTILVQFSRGAANEPKCSGLEVFGSAPATHAPVITGITVTNPVATLTWQSSAGVIYQMQSEDGLNASNWTACGNPVVASGSTTAATNNIANTGLRFYRIVQIN